MIEAEPELGRLDAAVGDGDHGAGMVRGFRAAVTANEGSTMPARQTFIQGGIAFQDAAGGASGALVGAWLMALGGELPESDDDFGPAALARGFEAGLAALQRLGGAELGDKTVADTLIPFTTTFEAAVMGGAALTEAWPPALAAAEAGMKATTDMISKRGRSSRLGERSRGHQDAGATSAYLVLRAFGAAFAGQDG
jgi:dihydroxyacetone kinase